MQRRFHAVEDYEEFSVSVADADSGIYVQELWQIHNVRSDKPVSDLSVARKAFSALYAREGWDRDLLLVSEGITLRPLPEDMAAGRVRKLSLATDLSKAGCWWATAPVGYWRLFDDPAARIFVVREGGLRLTLWAFEHTSRVAPEAAPPPLPEFAYRWEWARKGDTYHVYDTSPEAARTEEDLADLDRRLAPARRRFGGL